MKKKIIYSILFFLAIVFIQHYFLTNTKFNVVVFSDIITFLSIVFGFYITSLAIFVTSQYVSDLYKIVDKENQSLTLLHTLTNNYKFGLLLTLISLVYFIMIQFFVKTDASNEAVLGSASMLPALALLALNFIFCFIMLNDLVNIIIQEGKKRSQ